MHYVVCARYRDPVIRPSMDSMIFRNGTGGEKKDRGHDQTATTIQ